MRRASLIALVFVAAAVAGAWVGGLCTNRLFLFLLLSGAVTVIVAVPRSAAVSATLPFVVAWILLGRVWDRPVATHFSLGEAFVEIPVGGGFRYTFDFEPLRERRESCGPLNATLVIHGRNLKQATIDLIGISHLPVRIEKLYWLDRVLLDIPREVSRFSINVSGSEHGPTPAIYLGPQFHGNSLYAEAVFVTSENSQCRLVLHSRRRCGEMCPEILEVTSSQLLSPN